MGLIKRNLFIVILAMIFLLSTATDWYNILTLLFLCATIITILDKLGKGIVLRELIVLHAVFVCLAMPVVGYEVYNQHNHLSRIFVKYMRVPRDRYFGYVLPAVSLFSIALCWPITVNKRILDEGAAFHNLILEIRKILRSRFTTGVMLICVGIFMFYLQTFLPAGLRFVANLLYSACFAGLLYTFFSESFRYKRIVLVLFPLFIAYTAVQSGVFTIIAYMGITLFSFFFIGKRQAFWKKLLVCFGSIFLLFLIQNVKSSFRHSTWRGNYTGSKTELFSDLATERLSNLDKLTDVSALFPIYARTNQGFNIALVIRRIPDVQPFDNGSRLALIGASSLVPRVLWPDKPEAGGKESMRYFAGINIVGWSTNVSPIGEAYGSFGVRGGIIFMFALGIFIRLVYRRVFIIAQKTPLIVLWIPVLFFQVTYSMETDTLQILNSLFKSAFLIWILYKIFPSWFGVVKKSHRPPARLVNPPQNIPV